MGLSPGQIPRARALLRKVTTCVGRNTNGQKGSHGLRSHVYSPSPSSGLFPPPSRTVRSRST